MLIVKWQNSRVKEFLILKESVEKISTGLWEWHSRTSKQYKFRIELFGCPLDVIAQWQSVTQAVLGSITSKSNMI